MFDSSFRYGVWSFPHSVTSGRVVVFRVRLAVLEVDSSLREFVWSSCQFDSSAGLFDSSFYESDSLPTTSVRRRLSFSHFVVSSWRFIVSLCRFVVSTRPLRGAIIQLKSHSVLLDSIHSYMTYQHGSHNLLSSGEYWILCRATCATAYNSSWIEWMIVFMRVKMELNI